jgi:hypothetical protein
MGQLDKAREIVVRLRTITPVVIPDANYLRNAGHRELFRSGLRLAVGETACSIAAASAQWVIAGLLPI